MATAPYSIATTTPGDTDIMSVFPLAERGYRDTVWSWLNQIANATTGNLNPSAFPAFVTSWTVQALDGSSDAVLTYQNNSAVNRAKVLWNHTSDKLTLLTYAVDGSTIKTQLDLIGGAGTANINVAAGTLTVGGTAVVLTNSAVATAITGTGALTAGSIGGSFGAINIGANTLTAGAATVASLTSSGAVSGTTISGTSGTFSGLLQTTGSASISSNSNIFARGSVFEGGNGGAILQSGSGTPNPIFIRPTANSTTGQFTVATNGNVTASGDITANSDRRLKTSISPLNKQWANDMIREVQPMTFIWKRKGHERGIGFIAQDVEPYAPELVQTAENGIKSLAYPNMVAILWRVVQDLQARVEQLEAK